MINCPKCHELIADSVAKCPICHSLISEEDRREAVRNNERMQEEAIAESMAEYARRTRSEIIVGIVMILTVVIGTLLIVSLGINLMFLIALFAAVFIFYLFSVFKFHLSQCPYCETFMGRGRIFSAYCPKCGGRLR